MSTTQAAAAPSDVWFVTGASSGFGRAIVEALIDDGRRVVATARRPETLADLAARAPNRVLTLALDVTRPEQLEAALAAATARFGSVDVLVNNAGFSIIGALEETDDQALEETMSLMFFAAARATRAVLPGMRARGRGTIVQLTSMGGLTTAPGFGAYCAAKHALEGLSECLAAEVAPHGIRVLIVEPGAFRTALFGGAFRRMPENAAYATTSGGVRAWVSEADGKQPGDPAKAARAIVETVSRPGALPLRLPLGADAVDGIRAKLARVAADVDAAEAVARATTFDAPVGREA